MHREMTASSPRMTRTRSTTTIKQETTLEPIPKAVKPEKSVSTATAAATNLNGSFSMIHPSLWRDHRFLEFERIDTRFHESVPFWLKPDESKKIKKEPSLRRQTTATTAITRKDITHKRVFESLTVRRLNNTNHSSSTNRPTVPNPVLRAYGHKNKRPKGELAQLLANAEWFSSLDSGAKGTKRTHLAQEE